MLFVELEPGRMMTVSQAANALHCSRQKVMRMLHRGELAHHDSAPYRRTRKRLSTTFLPGEVAALLAMLPGVVGWPGDKPVLLSAIQRLRRLAAHEEKLRKEGEL
jgi:excisionase family DNA binding protein